MLSTKSYFVELDGNLPQILALVEREELRLQHNLHVVGLRPLLFRLHLNLPVLVQPEVTLVLLARH